MAEPITSGALKLPDFYHQWPHDNCHRCGARSAFGFFICVNIKKWQIRCPCGRITQAYEDQYCAALEWTSMQAECKRPLNIGEG